MNKQLVLVMKILFSSKLILCLSRPRTEAAKTFLQSSSVYIFRDWRIKVWGHNLGNLTKKLFNKNIFLSMNPYNDWVIVDYSTPPAYIIVCIYNNIICKCLRLNHFMLNLGHRMSLYISNCNYWLYPLNNVAHVLRALKWN